MTRILQRPSRKWNPVHWQRRLLELPELDSASLGSRVCIVMPHPDDETLAAAGLMQVLLAKGVDVQVYLATMGNKWGKQRQRRREVLAALQYCGVPEDKLTCPEFDDGYLSKQRRAVEISLRGYLSALQPTAIITTADNDIHRDHAVLGALTLKLAPEIASVQVVYDVMIHHAHFPRPIADAPAAPLLPPLKLARRQQTWRRLMLSPLQVEQKRLAVMQFTSQLRVPVLRSLLRSFIRANELYRLRYTRDI
jgi:LmbE family N-acetylglucosaminyl deacetylase